MESTIFVGGFEAVRGLAITATENYVANATDGLTILDPDGTLQGSETETFRGKTIACLGGTVYVAGTDIETNAATLLVLDMSVPTDPVIVGELSFGLAASFEDLAFDSVRSLLVLTTGSGRDLLTVDVSNPAFPTQLDTLDTGGDARGVALSGNNAYIANGFSGLLVADVSNPSALSIAGSNAFPGLTALDVAVGGNFAYVADLAGRFLVFDVSTPTPVFRTGRTLTGSVYHAALTGSTAAFISRDSTTDFLEIADVSSPLSPLVQSTTSVGSFDTGRGLALSGSRAYVANGAAGLKILDISIPTAPGLLAVGTTVGEADAVGLDLPQVCVADTPGTVSLFDLSP